MARSYKFPMRVSAWPVAGMVRSYSVAMRAGASPIAGMARDRMKSKCHHD